MNTHPPSGTLLAVIRPFRLSRISRHIASPNPVPLPDALAVKKGLKRAMRVFSNEDYAKDFAAEQTVPVEIEHRAGELVRCKGDYCGVAQFCSQYREGV